MTISLSGLLGFVVIALVAGLIAWALTVVVTRSPLDPSIKQIVNWAIFAIAIVIVLFALLQALGLVGGGPIILIGK